jgi:hypothetical protein
VARGQSEIRFGGGIGAKSIRDKEFRCKALPLEQLSLGVWNHSAGSISLKAPGVHGLAFDLPGFGAIQ